MLKRFHYKKHIIHVSNPLCTVQMSRIPNFAEKYRSTGRKLGDGAFADVYLVTNLKTGKNYAAKIAKQNCSTSLFNKEVKLLKLVSKTEQSEFIVNIIDILQPKIIVLELVTGGELFDEICKREKYSEQDAAVACEQLLKAIKFMHDNGVVHRDLKPENILLTSNYQIKVTDFGLAEVFDPKKPRSKIFNQFCGTKEYMATEMLQISLKNSKSSKNSNPIFYDETVDEFSAGVILYILLTGYPPWWNPSDKYICRITFEPVCWSGYSQNARDLVNRLACKDLNKRLVASDAISHSWFKDKLGVDHLVDTHGKIKEFNARRKFKAGVGMVRMILDMQKNHINK